MTENEMTNQAAQTMPERAYMTRDEALKIARACAYAKCHTHDYLPRTAQEAADWQPHEWALDAIRWNALSQTAGVVEGKRDREADRLRFPDADFNAWLDAGISDAGHTVYDSISSIEDAWQGWHGHVLSVMLDENPGLDAMLAAAPAASGAHPDALPDGTLSKSTAKRVTALAAASVSERARELLAAEYRSHGWHEDAGRLCMGGDPTSFVEDDALRVIDRLIEQGDEDAHVITELGRLLACIAVILKGPEPAGTAWSYHDLPELVASSLSEPRQIAAEMKAWAHTKMAEQQSSRRDRMMVSEWAKRLLPESSFPIKDFDVEGMSITKEAAREAVKRVAIEQALTQQRGEPFAWAMTDHQADGPMTILTTNREDAKFWGEQGIDVEPLYKSPQPSADAVREIYDAAAKGFHTSETNGAERKYLHVIRFQSIEDLHGYEDAWTAAMVKARDAK